MELSGIDLRPLLTDSIIDRLIGRDVVLWSDDLRFEEGDDQEKAARFFGLPWRFVISESRSESFAESVSSQSSSVFALRRGPVFAIAGNPDDRDLPRRCLPIYFLNGLSGAKDLADSAALGGIQAQRRRMNVIGRLLDTRPPVLVVVPGTGEELLHEVIGLWNAGDLRAEIVFANPSPKHHEILSTWITPKTGPRAITVCTASLKDLFVDAERRCLERSDRATPHIRFKVPLKNDTVVLDISKCESPSAPLLDRFIVVQSSDLTPTLPEELKAADLNGFFDRSIPETSSRLWQPYAAGLPWSRFPGSEKKLLRFLAKVERDGADANALLLLDSEPGAGGTTEARRLAFAAASAGYPSMVASSAPFTVDADEIGQFLYQVHQTYELTYKPLSQDGGENPQLSQKRAEVSIQRETPWLIVFDTQHWRGREEQLGLFMKKLQRLARPLAILIVNEVPSDVDFGFPTQHVHSVPLTHEMQQAEVENLGNHVNRYLPSGRKKEPQQWMVFWRENRVEVSIGSFSDQTRSAAFWVALEFWLRGQLQIGVSIRQWLYRQFVGATYREQPLSPAAQRQILQIAALSIEREGLPEQLIPSPPGADDPLTVQLEALRKGLPSIGLSRISTSTGPLWCISHVPLARHLLDAISEDAGRLKVLGLPPAPASTEVRLELLRQIATNPELRSRRFKQLAERFAVTILKLDRSLNLEFARHWRLVLQILEEMPDALWDTSRSFNHHVAISRRRVASDDEIFPDKTPAETRRLLQLAIEHLEYALKLDQNEEDSDERDLNLFNSLARSYQDLAEFERRSGATPETVQGLLDKASEFTRRAKDTSPTSPYVLETLARELIQAGRMRPDEAVSKACEALEYIHQAMHLETAIDRRRKLKSAMSDAYSLLVNARGLGIEELKARGNPIGNVAAAWTILSASNQRSTENLSSIPPEDLDAAFAELDLVPMERREWPLLKLQYDIFSARHPLAFERQLSLLDKLEGTPAVNVQTRLERAILLHLNQRHRHADQEFLNLRRELRESGAIVSVPKRLRAFVNGATGKLIECEGRVVQSTGFKQLARVKNLGDVAVPFEPLEFGEREMPVGRRIRCTIDFSFRGPFAHPIETRGLGDE